MPVSGARPPQIATRFLIISDTHGDSTPLPTEAVDVVIHCGDLTEGSKLEEFRATIELMRKAQASLKLMIAGNHDWTLDTPIFKKKISEIRPPVEHDLIKREYGDFDEARQLLKDAESDGIVFLDQGNHSFVLSNGAALKVYTSPYTPSTNDWAFQYDIMQGHDFDPQPGTDIVITHGPPRGILDYVDSQRAGCPALFAAVARARPSLHCFGHIHSGWGARSVSWKPLTTSPSHFTDIDNDKEGSYTVEKLSGLLRQRFDDDDMALEKRVKVEKLQDQGYCTANAQSDVDTTLFVNAAVQGSADLPYQLPWIVQVELDPA